MSLRFSFSDFDGDQGFLNGYFDPMKEAADAAMTEVAELAKKNGRAHIAGVGFSKNWQNALRSEKYPKKRQSINASAWVYHRIKYAGIFESGGQIAGDPLLWLPLSTTPKLGKFTRLSPNNFKTKFNTKLITMQNGKRPMLGAPMTVTKSAARKGPPYKITAANLRKGASGQGIIRTVPVFIGIDTVAIRKRLNLIPVFRAAADQIGALYLKNLKA
jgi:hypothetical protein